MTLRRMLVWVFAVVAVLVLVCVLIFENSAATPATVAMTNEQKKSQLQEQLGEELRNYYMGDDNWYECKELIDQIEKL